LPDWIARTKAYKRPLGDLVAQPRRHGVWEVADQAHAVVLRDVPSDHDAPRRCREGVGSGNWASATSARGGSRTSCGSMANADKSGPMSGEMDKTYVGGKKTGRRGPYPRGASPTGFLYSLPASPKASRNRSYAPPVWRRWPARCWTM